MPMQPALLHTALLLALGGTSAARADSADASTAVLLDTVVVTATRTERTIAEVPNNVSAITRERMDAELVRDLKDLFRYEPGISVTSSVGRFGLGDIRIRGLGGNRVRIETDGVPVSDAFAIGSFSNANRNFVDLDTLKRVEIVRGPGSALYGSDALGGVVAFITKDPADYLHDGDTLHTGLKLGYDSENHGQFAGATLAAGGERWSGLLAIGHRQGEAPRNQGVNDSAGALRTTANPQDNEGRSLLGKLVYAPDERQRFRLTVEGNEDLADTEVLSALGLIPGMHGAPPVLVASMRGDDQQTRARLSFAHEIDSLDARWADSLHWQLYRQDSETTQQTREERASLVGGIPLNPTRREREFNFDQRVHGIEATLHKRFNTGNAEHALTWGFEYTRTGLRQKRDGRAVNLTTGASTSFVLPDRFPVRDFPVSRTEVLAVFVQNEIALLNGDLRLVPGLRVDHYRLRPELDNIFAEDNPGLLPSGLRETALSPRLGAVWQFAPAWSVFAGYQHGFRAPPYNDVNLGFTNLMFGYTAIPNPDLKPETSDGIELGLRYAGGAVHAEATLFYNRYDNFIESLRVVSAPPQTPLRVFQSQNVSEAVIRGAELRLGVELGAGWSLRGSAAWAKGEDRTANRPLSSVDPLRAALGLAYDRDTWGIELAGRFAQSKRDLAPATQFAPPGHGVLDLLAHWDIAAGVSLNAGLFNLTDRKYWDWADVTGVAGDSPVLDRYTRPGRSVGLSAALSW